MPILQTNLRLSDTNRPDVAAYLPPSYYLLGFTTSVRQNSLGNAVHDPRAVARREVRGGGAPGAPPPGTVFLR
jgi:hypothetical protein